MSATISQPTFKSCPLQTTVQLVGGILIPFSKGIQPPTEFLAPPIMYAQTSACLLQLSHPGSRIISLNPIMVFIRSIPTDTLDISDLILPSKKLCKILEENIYKKLSKKGCNSVQHLGQKLEFFICYG